MSCEIRLSSVIEDIPSIRRCLFPSDDNRGSDGWLQLCKISVAPTGEIIALANERRLVVLTSKWGSEPHSSSFQISYHDTIHEYDKVKAILCLPIVGDGHSSLEGPKWNCIVIGFDSGYVRFYNDQCDLLMEDQFHSENISSIRCQSQHSPRPDLTPDVQTEELYIQYQSNICVITGQELFENLKHFQRLVSKGKFKHNQFVNLLVDLKSSDKILPLNVRKWGFQDQTCINDAIVVGLNMSNDFDHLLTASICGGFDAQYRNTSPNSTLVITAGSKPFLGYHYALEGGNQLRLTEVAKVVAGTIKSVLPGWLRSSPKESKEVSIALQSIDNMGLRFGLNDLKRKASEIVLSPNKKLVTVSDSLGRVLLVDAFKGLTIKIFKGYREAQCAFLQVPDERRSKHRPGNKVATFLIIYSPNKGTLEIFTVQQGTKVATFFTSKHSKLIYINYGLMGFGAARMKSRYVCQFTCLFLDNDGNINEVFVPFHFAVAEKDSVRAKDIHLYKKLKHNMKTGIMEEMDEMICRICSELQTSELKLQTMYMLLGSRNVSAQAILQCSTSFLNQTDADANFETLCRNAKAVVEFYIFLTEPAATVENDNSEEPSSHNLLNLDESDLKGLQRILDLVTSSSDVDLKTPRVRFANDAQFSISDFLSCFDLIQSESISVNGNAEEDRLFQASEVIFSPYISNNKQNFEQFASIVSASKLIVKDLINLLIQFWINRSLNISLNLEQDMDNFLKILSALVTLCPKELIELNNCKMSNFWETIRVGLAANSRPFPSLMAAMLCKNVALRTEVMEASEENIEVLSHENIEWSLLIGKLEDVSTLNIILATKPQVNSATLPKLVHKRVEISLKYILEQGRGSVSELCAKWLSSSGVNPGNILINDIIFKNSQIDLSETPSEPLEISEGMHLETIGQVKHDAIFKFLNILMQEFPYSLGCNAILANMCWEYALAWRAEVTNLEYLQAAVECANTVPDRSIRRGLMQLIWDAHLKIILESSSKLINKVGRLPKDRLCQQDTGLTVIELTKFIGICTEFVESFLTVVQQVSDAEKPELKFEAIWDNGGPPPLLELTLQQKDVDINLLYLHYQLCLVLHMITTFRVKFSKPINNLFEPSLVNLFFTDLQRQVCTNWNKSDINRDTNRYDFLTKIVSSSMETVTVDDDRQVYAKDHMEWMEKCLKLASIWNIGVDSLRRFQIVQLYRSGFDLMAQDLIPAVSDVTFLAEDLLIVAGKRLQQYVEASEKYSESFAALSPPLKQFLDRLMFQDDNWCLPSDLKHITILASLAMGFIKREDQERLWKMAELMLDACITLESINNK